MAPAYVDVRDIARAHIEALNTPSMVKGRKRAIISSPYDLDYKMLEEAIKKAKPELTNRLRKTPEPDFFSVKRFGFDFARVEEVLGMKEKDFYTVKQVCPDFKN